MGDNFQMSETHINGSRPLEQQTKDVNASDAHVEHIMRGFLRYKPPGIKFKNLYFSKKFFWLCTVPDEAALKLDARGSDTLSPTTSKSLVLYYAENEESYENPGGILKIPRGTEVNERKNDGFTIRIGHKMHTFRAKNEQSRNLWLLTLQDLRQDLNSTL